MISRLKSTQASAALICFGLLLLVLSVFGQSINGGFIDFDDPFYVTENWHVLQGLSLNNIWWALGAGTGHYMVDTDYWMPLTLISHMAGVQLFGLHPAGHHAVNVLLHAASTASLFLVLRSMTGSLWKSAFVAALWSVHPLRVESVAWITERKDVLSGLFFMLTLAAYLKYVRKPSAARYMILLIPFVLGLMSKPIGVTLPLVLLLLDYWPLQRMGRAENRRSLPALVLEKLPLLALSAMSCLITIFTQKQTLDPNGQIPLFLRAGNACVSYCIYLKKMLWPTDLAVFYPYPAEGRPIYQGLLGVLLILIISLSVIRLRRSHRYLVTGWFWYLVMLAPVSGILRAGAQAYADRFTYLPMVGLVIAITWAVGSWVGNQRLRKILSNVGAVTLVLACSLAAFRQCRYWRDSETLFHHSLSCTRDNFLIENNLGSVLWHEGRTSEAVDHVTTALSINPASADAHNNMGTILWNQGRRKEAIDHFRKALELLPSHGAAHNNLGNALLQTGSSDEALPHLKLAVEIIPGSSEAHYNLGNAMLRGGNPSDAIREFQEALSINPSSAEVQNTLGSVLAGTGSPQKGIVHLQRAIKLDPENPAFLNNLAWVLATCPDHSLRDASRAVDLAEKATRLDGGNNPSHLRTLAAAYAWADRFDAAVQTAERAEQLAQAQGNPALCGFLQNDLLNYRNGTSHP